MKLAEQVSNDINMSFGLDKCAVLTLKNGSYSTTNILPEIPKLDEDSNRGYQYLGIMEGADFHTQKVKENTIKKYFSRVRKILNAQLPGDDMMTVMCAHATPIL
eukprot:9937714-Ditylum_brightwellii.AAC.1